MSKRILIVDSDADTRTLYRTCLSLEGIDIVDASDGRDALAKVFVHPPALVVTELRLPYLDGYALCDILRRDRTTANVPILVITTEARSVELDRARQSGADAVLVKPTTPEAIVNEIRRLLASDDGDSGSSTADILNRSPQHRGTKRMALARLHQRFSTITPPAQPPSLVCPSCDRPLAYEQSRIGGVSDKHSEQWDYYVCASCGAFQYRQRTRKLRRVSTGRA
jgi:CheY-like chemotaxis protein